MTYVDYETGYVVQFPDSWYGFEYSEGDMQQTIDAMREANVDDWIINSVETLGSDSATALEMMAMDSLARSGSTNYAANANIASDERSGPYPMKSFISLLEAQLPQVVPGIQIESSGTYALPNGELAGYLEYILTYSAPNVGTLRVHGFQTYLQIENTKVVLTLSAPAEGFDEVYNLMFQEIAASFLPLELATLNVNDTQGR